MSMWTMIFLVVVVSLIYSGWETWLRHQRKSSGGGKRDGALEVEVEALRARVEALETIVTDADYDLKRRIDELEAPRRSVG
jgi:hypothetical protein